MAEELGQYTVDVSAAIAEFKKLDTVVTQSVSSITSSFKALAFSGQQAGNLGVQFDVLGSKIGNVANPLRGLAVAYEATTDRGATLAKVIVNSSNAAAKSGSNFASLERTVQELVRSFSGVINSLSEVVRGLATVTTSLNGVITGTQAYASAQREANTAAAASAKAKDEAARSAGLLGSAYQALTGGATRAAGTTSLLGTAFRGLGQAASAVTTSIGNLLGNLARIGAAVAAVGLIRKAIGGVTQAVREGTEANKTQQKDIVDDSNERVSAYQEQVGFENKLAAIKKKSNDDFLAGRKSAGEAAVEEQEARRAAFKEREKELAQAERLKAIKEDEQRLQEKARIRQAEAVAFAKLASMVGTQAASAFTQLGATIARVQQQVVQGFSPALANIVTGLNSAISEAAPQINKFFKDVFAMFGTTSGQAKEFFTKLITGALEFARVTLTIVIAAVKFLGAVFTVIAQTVNGIFGTQWSAQGIAAALLLARLVLGVGGLTLAFKAAGAAITLMWLAFSRHPIGALITLIGVLIIYLTTKLDWAAIADRAAAAWARIKAGAADLYAYFQNTPWWLIILDGIDKLFPGFRQQVLNIINKYFELVEYIKNTPWWQIIIDGINLLFPGFKQWVEDVKAKWQEIKDTGIKAFEDIKTYIMGTWIGDVLRAFDRAIEKVRTLLGLQDKAAAGGAAGGGGPATVKAATGGYIRGPGTGTSDSILARLSNREYVINAKRVKQLGVGFFHAINRGKLKDILPGFATGGLVAAPAYAGARFRAPTGGRTANETSRTAFDLVLDGQRYGGLSAPQDTAQALQQAGVRRRLVAAGKPNSWQGRK